MRSATSSTRSVMITRSLCPRSSRACCASCTLIAPSSPQLALLGREHSNCTSCAQRIVDPQLEPLRNSAFGLSVRRMGSMIYTVETIVTVWRGVRVSPSRMVKKLETVLIAECTTLLLPQLQLACCLSHHAYSTPMEGGTSRGGR